MVRFEILLPLYYNDGRPVEQEKFLETDEELVARFGATSTDSVIVSGHWVYLSTVYEDRLVRVRVDAPDTPDSRAFLRTCKETLKRRFGQEDIWVTAQQIEVI
jgi:hypothetical protein